MLLRLAAQRNTIQRARMVNGTREDRSDPAYHSDWDREVFVDTDLVSM